MGKYLSWASTGSASDRHFLMSISLISFTLRFLFAARLAVEVERYKEDQRADHKTVAGKPDQRIVFKK